MKCTLFLYLFVYLFACIFHSFLHSHAFTMFAAYDNFISLPIDVRSIRKTEKWIRKRKPKQHYCGNENNTHCSDAFRLYKIYFVVVALVNDFYYSFRFAIFCFCMHTRFRWNGSHTDGSMPRMYTFVADVALRRRYGNWNRFFFRFVLSLLFSIPWKSTASNDPDSTDCRQIWKQYLKQKLIGWL